MMAMWRAVGLALSPEPTTLFLRPVVWCHAEPHVHTCAHATQDLSFTTPLLPASPWPPRDLGVPTYSVIFPEEGEHQEET